MSVFSNYARYYDLLYRDKNYADEAQFIHRLIQRSSGQAKTILELGCGTGKHAALMAQQGYTVHGVDLSQEMLISAKQRVSELPLDVESRLKFTHGDIRDVRLNQVFDVVISLFHVVSYHTTNEDLIAAFATVKKHLKPGGIFIFDVWYGPAVLTHRPTVRVKRLEDDCIQVTRLAEPTLHANKNIVDVNYQVLIRDKATNNVEEVMESHHMRYLFYPEIKLLLGQTHLKLNDFGEWMTANEAGFDTWGVYFIAQS